MTDSKFSMNVLLLIVIIVSAFIFFFTVTLVDIAYNPAYNEFYPIEGTEYCVRYSSLDPSGIYKGSRAAGVLKLKGTYGYDWGAAVVGDQLYLNEYVTTEMGYMLCNLVRVDLNTFEKEVLYRDTILRGRCASGELVCISGFIMPSNYPETNPTCRLYAMSAGDMDPTGRGGTVMFIDGADGETVYSVWDGDAASDSFDGRYLGRTLEEVRG